MHFFLYLILTIKSVAEKQKLRTADFDLSLLRIDRSICFLIARLNKKSKFDNNLIIHYTYEKRLKNNKKTIHQLWNQTFDKTPIKTTRLIIGNRNQPNMTTQLIHRRPR